MDYQDLYNEYITDALNPYVIIEYPELFTVRDTSRDNFFLTMYKSGLVTPIYYKLLELAPSYILGLADRKGLDLLLLACINNDKDMIKFLLTKTQINPYRNSYHGMSILNMAIGLKLKEVLAILFKKFPVETENASYQTDLLGNTILHTAVRIYDPDIFKFLSRKTNFSSMMNVQNHDGETPLFIAAEKGLVDPVRTLVKYGADVDIADFMSQTPLFIAAKMGCFTEDREPYEEIIRLLQSRAALETITTTHGESVTDYYNFGWDSMCTE